VVVGCFIEFSPHGGSSSIAIIRTAFGTSVTTTAASTTGTFVGYYCDPVPVDASSSDGTLFSFFFNNCGSHVDETSWFRQSPSLYVQDSNLPMVVT
jgi:hypothetical protein